jgi:hypothetical protein
MALASLMLGAFLGFLAGVLAMSLLRVAAFDPPTLKPASDPAAARDRDAAFAGRRNDGVSRH